MSETVSNEIVAHLILCKSTQPFDGGPLTAHLCALARHRVVGLYELLQDALTTLCHAIRNTIPCCWSNVSFVASLLQWSGSTNTSTNGMRNYSWEHMRALSCPSVSHILYYFVYFRSSMVMFLAWACRV